MKRVRASSPALDGILGDEIPVLDHGFVSVLDYMGNDGAVVEAARKSYKGTPRTEAEDRGLIRHMIRENHSSPFETGCDIKFAVRLPLFVEAQWVRHRTAKFCCWNQFSYRYTEADEEFFLPDEDAWRLQSTTNKQGSDGLLDVAAGQRVRNAFQRITADAFDVYRDALAAGVSREQARTVLPQNIYTEKVIKVDLSNLLHFLQLRADPHAQQEIREYAEVIAQIVKGWVPVTFAAWLEYRRNAVTFSSSVWDVLRNYLEMYSSEYDPDFEKILEKVGVGKSEIRDVMARLGL
jgi:thymidylate synthase (FAD)